MNDRDDATARVLARIGIAITRQGTAGNGWGWTMQNAKIIRDWDGPYATPAMAIEAALAWVLEYARKGLLCHHVHAATPETAIPVDGDGFAQASWYTLN